ncbi:MAG TPA: peroxiredoxin [Thermoplasmata archaeon]|jgi:peroxiredoxin Q/BCP|nr:peroxiredoxin [Thermoplasmata archaeon]
MVGVGEPAPEFEGPSSTGGKFRLSEHRGHPVVIYFFPKADTPGCTIETKAFRDLHPEFQKRHVTVIGVSVDDPEDETKFATKYDVPFGLVADPDKTIATKYGVLGPHGTARRVTFLIGPDGKVLQTVDGSPLDHVAAAKARFLSG